jgi:hypothetical protein
VPFVVKKNNAKLPSFLATLKSAIPQPFILSLIMAEILRHNKPPVFNPLFIKTTFAL